jgi:hypothetical protein
MFSDFVLLVINSGEIALMHTTWTLLKSVLIKFQGVYKSLFNAKWKT